jgi:hypothetical protein
VNETQALRAQPFQLFKPLLRGLAQRLNRVSEFLMGLTLHAGEGYAFHLRFALHNPRSIGNLDALNLPSVTGEENAGPLLFREPEHPLHLTARDHPGIIDDQGPTVQRRLDCALSMVTRHLALNFPAAMVCMLSSVFMVLIPWSDGFHRGYSPSKS